MKISLNWVKEYAKLDLPLEELLAKIGAQLGAVESVVDLGAKYRGLVVAKVVACQSHPNADKLSICLIDDGGAVKNVKRDKDGHVQVVCGAKNVRRDQLVAWCPPGAVVPSTFNNEPLKLAARDIRGYKSFGMLLSGSELDINNDQTGILEIDQPAQPGTPLAEVYQLNDHIIEIENKMFTHRPDCFGLLGIAREIAGIQGKAFQSPKWYLEPNTEYRIPNTELGLEVKNLVPKLCPRFMAVVIAGIKVGPSPTQLQSYLSRLGIKPINNVVDLTNHYMVLTGQPLHAYDWDRVKGEGRSAKLVVRQAKAGETLKILGGKTIKLRPSDIVIADDKRAIGLAGVIGGALAEVSDNTRNIILECATFERHAIHRSSMSHGLFTEASTRFSKYQSPLQNPPVLSQAVAELIKLTGGQVASEVIDEHKGLNKPADITLGPEFINQRLGLNLPAQAIAKLLKNVEFGIRTSGFSLRVTPPFWRTDIVIAEDIVEEVGRLYGYDHLPLTLPKRDLMPAQPEPLLKLKTALRDTLARLGANEVLTYGFVHGSLMKKVGQHPAAAFQISNALSPDLQYYRLSLLPSLLELVHPNIKAGYADFALFEINKNHHKSQLDKTNLPVEEERLALVFAADNKSAPSSFKGAPYFQAAKYLSELLGSLGIRPGFVPFEQKNYRSAVISDAMAPFDPARSAYVLNEKGDLLGLIGEFKMDTQNSLKLPSFAAGFELNIIELAKANLLPGRGDSGYVIEPRFPKVEQDICLRVKADITYQHLSDFVWQQLLKLQPANVYSTLIPVDIYQKDKSHKQITLRLNIASYERTLESAAVNNLLDKIASAAKAKLGALRI